MPLTSTGKELCHLWTCFRNIFDLPMVLTNDANAAAIGEKVFGGAKDMNDFIVITLGTGLGSGFVTRGKLIYGHDGLAGELGHANVYPDGRQCNCGKRGCLETYASASGIKRTVFKLMATNNIESPLRTYTYETLSAKKNYRDGPQWRPAGSGSLRIHFQYSGTQTGRCSSHDQPGGHIPVRRAR